MKNFLMSSIFRRWLSLAIAVLVPFVNEKFGWNLDVNEVLGILFVLIAHISVEAHFDVKKAISAGVSATNTVLQTSTMMNPGVTIQPLQVPKMSYQEVAPYIINVHNALNAALNQVQSGKYNDAMQQAINLYMSIHTFLQHIEAAPVITSENLQKYQPEEKGA